MALNTKTIAVGALDILNVDGGITGSAKQIFDGDGTGSPFYITTSVVGIGIAAPVILLHVEKSVAGNYVAKFNNTHGSNGFGVYIKAGDDSDVNTFICENTSGDSMFKVRGDGNVGIGITAPSSLLHIQGTAAIATLKLGRSDTGTTNTMGQIFFGNSTDTTLAAIYGVEDGANDAGKLIFYTEKTGETTSPRMTIKSDGKIGIGTTSPSSLLHIDGVGSNGTFTLERSGSTMVGLFQATATALRMGTENADLVEITTNGNSRMTFDTAGRVLIGHGATDGMGRRLQVLGTTNDTASAEFQMFLANTDGPNLDLTHTRAAAPGDASSGSTELQSGDLLGSINFRGDDTTDTNSTGAIISAECVGTVSSNVMPTKLTFHTANTTPAARMTIDKDGNVGIGTTSPISALEIEDGLTTVGAILTLGTKEPSVVANDVLGRINFYAPLDTGTDSDEIGASIVAIAQATFSDSDNSTALQFQTGKSEVATTKMTINEDGDVLPGITESQDLGSAALEWDNIYLQTAATVSDERRKENVVDTPFGLDFINKLRPVEFKLTDLNYQVKVEGAVEAVEGKDAVYETKEAVYENVEVSPAVEATDDHPGKEAAYEQVLVSEAEEVQVSKAVAAVAAIPAVYETRTITHHRKHHGLIAQEVKSVLDEMNIDTENFGGYVDANIKDGVDKLFLRYSEFIAPMMRAIQELSAKVDELTNNQKQGDNNVKAQDGAGSSGGSSSEESDNGSGPGQADSGVSESVNSSSDASGGDSGSDSSSDSDEGAAQYPEGNPSAEWTKDQLKAYMDANGVAYNSGDTKDDLISKIEGV